MTNLENYAHEDVKHEDHEAHQDIRYETWQCEVLRLEQFREHLILHAEEAARNEDREIAAGEHRHAFTRCYQHEEVLGVQQEWHSEHRVYEGGSDHRAVEEITQITAAARAECGRHQAVHRIPNGEGEAQTCKSEESGRQSSRSQLLLSDMAAVQVETIMCFG